jgi:hypothetical protein
MEHWRIKAFLQDLKASEPGKAFKQYWIILSGLALLGALLNGELKQRVEKTLGNVVEIVARFKSDR